MHACRANVGLGRALAFGTRAKREGRWYSRVKENLGSRGNVV
jgi:hypothetical protein